jgi:hypothetical protein
MEDGMNQQKLDAEAEAWAKENSAEWPVSETVASVLLKFAYQAGANRDGLKRD